MRRFVRTVAVRRMGGHSGGAHGVQKGAPLPAPEEGSLPEKPENDLYQAGDPNYVFKGRVSALRHAARAFAGVRSAH